MLLARQHDSAASAMRNAIIRNIISLVLSVIKTFCHFCFLCVSNSFKWWVMTSWTVVSILIANSVTSISVVWKCSAFCEYELLWFGNKWWLILGCTSESDVGYFAPFDHHATCTLELSTLCTYFPISFLLDSRPLRCRSVHFSPCGHRNFAFSHPFHFCTTMIHTKWYLYLYSSMNSHHPHPFEMSHFHHHCLCHCLGLPQLLCYWSVHLYLHVCSGVRIKHTQYLLMLSVFTFVELKLVQYSYMLRTE